MSHHYFVSPPANPAEWSQPIAELERQIRARWPDARIKLIEEGEYRPNALEWEVPMTHNLLVGGVVRDGTSIVLRGDLRDCAEVAVWFREIVPDVQPLIFFDEGGIVLNDFHRGMKPDEVAAPFLESEAERARWVSKALRASGAKQD